MFVCLALLLSINASVPASTAVITKTSTKSGVFTILKKGEKAIFAGVLLDNRSLSTILADVDLEANKCTLQTNFLLNKLRLESGLQLEQLKITLNTQAKTNDVILKAKDEQIKALVDKGNGGGEYKNYLLFFSGGVVAGIVSVVLIVHYVHP